MTNSLFEGGNKLKKSQILKKMKESAKPLVINVPLNSIDGCDFLDMARDYLIASFVGERIARHCKNVKFSTVKGRPPRSTAIEFAFIPEAYDALSAELCMLQAGLSDRNDKDAESFERELDRYELSLLYDDIGVKFPTLVDVFFENLTSAILNEWDASEIEKLEKKHPGILYAFWKSPHSVEVGYDVQISSYCWIIPEDADVKKILRAYSKIGSDPSFEKALRISLDNNDYLIAGNKVMRLDSNRIKVARMAAVKINEQRLRGQEHMTELLDLLCEGQSTAFFVDVRNKIALFKDAKNQFVYFEPAALKPRQIKGIHDEIKAILDKLTWKTAPIH